MSKKRAWYNTPPGCAMLAAILMIIALVSNNSSIASIVIGAFFTWAFVFIAVGLLYRMGR